MIANALIVTIAIGLALAFWLMGELRFLIPYKRILIYHYGGQILAWSAAVFANLFAGIYAIQRKFFLKDTGRKLLHIDHQLAVGHAPVSPPTLHEEQL